MEQRELFERRRLDSYRAGFGESVHAREKKLSDILAQGNGGEVGSTAIGTTLLLPEFGPAMGTYEDLSNTFAAKPEPMASAVVLDSHRRPAQGRKLWYDIC